MFVQFFFHGLVEREIGTGYADRRARKRAERLNVMELSSAFDMLRQAFFMWILAEYPNLLCASVLQSMRI